MGNSDAAGPAPPGATGCPAIPVPVDTTRADQVIGDGTPGSCTDAALGAAATAGGIVRFNCGSALVRIAVQSEKRISRSTVIDGGGTVTLDGGDRTRFFGVFGNYDPGAPSLTVQNLAFEHGKAGVSPGASADVGAFAGGAILRRSGGTLTVINCQFRANRAAETGSGRRGGAIYTQGGETIVVRSVFEGNRASNGGAIGLLRANGTILETVFSENQAVGARPGGGNGGALADDGSHPGTPRPLTICGSVFRKGNAKDSGGGLYRFSYPGESTMIDRTFFDGNVSGGRGGAIYHQASPLTITSSTLANNRAPNSGGLAINGPGMLTMTNTTVVSNTAESSLGGGIAIDGDLPGLIRNCTIALNGAPSPASFGGGIFGGPKVKLANTIIANNRAGNAFNPISCTSPLLSGGPNLQWPATRPGGGADTLCATGVLLADPLLGPLQDSGTIAPSMPLSAGSPAIGAGADCPKTDQRGQTRQRCDLGAVAAP